MNAMRLTQLIGIGLAAYGGWRYFQHRQEERRSWKYRLAHNVVDPASELASTAFGHATTASAALGEKAGLFGSMFRDFAGRADTDEARRFLRHEGKRSRKLAQRFGHDVSARADELATGTVGLFEMAKAKAPFFAAKSKAVPERFWERSAEIAQLVKDRTKPVADIAVVRAQRAAEVALPAAGKAIKATPEAIKVGGEKAVAGAAAAGAATAGAAGSLISNTLWLGALGGLVYYLYAPRSEDRVRLQTRLRDLTSSDRLAA